MTLQADEQDFGRLFPDVRRVERPIAFRNFRAGRQQFDHEDPSNREENCRKAMKLAFSAAGYQWIVLSIAPGLPAALLISFHSNFVVDILAGVFGVLFVALYGTGVDRGRRARAIYPGKVRASWAGFWPPSPDGDR